MDLLSRNEVETLLQQRPGWHVSLYMRMLQRGAETQQNPIRCKTSLCQVEERLLANGVRPQEAQDLLRPVQQLLANRVFWQRQSHGLALFLAPEVWRAFRLPLTVDEVVVVSRRFHVKPLLPLLSGDGHFFVLALSQKAVRLLRGTAYRIDEVAIQGMPQGIADALRYEDIEKKDHHFPGSQGRLAGGVSPQAGHGVGIEDATHEPRDPILRYFHQVDAALRAFMRDEHAPLVLAGVEYLLPNPSSRHPAAGRPGSRWWRHRALTRRASMTVRAVCSSVMESQRSPHARLRRMKGTTAANRSAAVS